MCVYAYVYVYVRGYKYIYVYVCVCDPQTRAAKQDIGKVFLLFAEINAAEKCNAAMHNRTFSDRQIRAYFLPEEEFISLKLAYQ